MMTKSAQSLVVRIKLLLARSLGRCAALALVAAALLAAPHGAYAASSNNYFVNAININLGTVQQGPVATTGNLSNELDLPPPSVSAGANYFPAWWKYTAASTGWVVVSTNGTNYDTVLDVWTGTSPVSGLTKIGYNDDYLYTGSTSTLAFYAISGTTYHFRVEGYYSTSFGSVYLSLQSAPTASITATTNWNAEGTTTTTAFTVNLSSSLVDPVNLTYTAAGTAPSAHYSLSPAPGPATGVTIPGGATSATVSLTSFNDSLVTGNMTVVATLTGTVLSGFDGGIGSTTFGVNGTTYGQLYYISPLVAPTSATCTIVDAQSPYVYVNLAATSGGNNGTSWANAFTDLHGALATAVNSNQIWVAQGTYSTTSQTDDFAMVAGTTVYGGFTGGETALSQRDRFTHATILSGNYGGGQSFHVVIGANSCLLDGFTVTGGNASGAGGGLTGYGGGVLAEACGQSITRCVFDTNIATEGGGAVWLVNDTAFQSTITQCYFVNNSCTDSTSPYGGGGIFYYTSGSPAGTLVNCVFANNSTANSASSGGGGGAVIAYAANNLAITNCTFYGNAATATGGVGGGIYNFNSGNVTVTNCIFSTNTSGPLAGGIPSPITSGTSSGTQTVSFSCFQDASFPAGVTNGGGNGVGINPNFKNPGLTKLELAGPDLIYGTSDDGLTLLSPSFALDNGTGAGAPKTSTSPTTAGRCSRAPPVRATTWAPTRWGR